MNFLKRTGLIFIIIITISSSCDKHMNNDVVISTKLDKLAYKFKGVTELCTDLAIMNDKVASLRKSIPEKDGSTSITLLGKGLTAIRNRNDSISSMVIRLANNRTTKVLIESLNDDITSLSLQVKADKDYMTSQIKSNGFTNIVQSYRMNELLSSNSALITKIADMQKTLKSLTIFTGDIATQVAVDVLIIQMNCEKVSFEILLASYVP